MNHFDYRDGVLHVEELALPEIARQIGTPFYCYSTATLERHYRVFAEAKIGLNRHIDAAAGYSNNLRLYDVTGVGALLFTEPGTNLAELFDPQSEVVTYEGARDLAGKIRYYLRHEDERAAIAAAGQERTLRDHNWLVRMTELVALLERHL